MTLDRVIEDRGGLVEPAFRGELALIAEMSREFAASRDVQTSLEKAVARITDHVGAEGGAVFMIDDVHPDEIECRACVGPVKITGMRLRTDEGVVGHCVRLRRPEIVRDALNDPHFEATVDAETGFTTRSILVAPLAVQDQIFGAIELVNKKGADTLFDKQDQQLLETLASSAALALLNARLAADLAEQEADRREVELAAELQRSLLPRPIPPPFPVAGVNVPARRVSGDFYDFLTLDDGRIAFAIGDVAGKGMNAALLMAKTASLFRCLAKSVPEPGRLLGVINDEICETATRGVFVTMVIGVLHPESGRVCLANAGHEPPLLQSADGEFRDLPAEAPPVGIVPGFGDDGAFPETAVDLAGGTLYVFTDGVTEAHTSAARDARLGVEGLKLLIGETANLRGPERVAAIVERIRRDPLHDDLTLLAVDGGGATG